MDANIKADVKEKLRQAIFSGSGGQEKWVLRLIYANWLSFDEETKTFIRNEITTSIRTDEEISISGDLHNIHLVHRSEWLELRKLVEL